jgi:hypothetical protein
MKERNTTRGIAAARDATVWHSQVSTKVTCLLMKSRRERRRGVNECS